MPTYDPNSTRINAKRVGSSFAYDALKGIIDAIRFLIHSLIGK